MAEININLLVIDNAISKLQALKSKCVSAKTAAPTTVGGGQTVNELEKIAKQYQDIDLHLELLVGNTISFLTNLKSSYNKSEQKAVKNLGGGVRSSGKY